MKTKRVWSFLLSFALLVTSVTGVPGRKADAEETAKKIVVYVAAEGKNENGDEVTIYKTPVQVTGGSMAETAVIQVLDYSYKDNYVYKDGFLSSIGKVEGTSTPPYLYWGFQVNGEEPQNPDTGWGYGIADYPLKDQDQISLVFGEYGSMPKGCSSYANDTSLAPDADAQAALIESAKKQQNVLAQKIYETNFKNKDYVPGITDTDSLYDVFSLVQAGYQADEFYNDVASKIASELRALHNGRTISDASGENSYTLETYEANKYVIINYAKIALVMAALGQDITDVGGMDLTEKLTDKKNYENANPTTLTRESLILFAMDAADASWHEGDFVTKAEMIKNISDDIENQISFATDWTSAWGATLDSAAMAVQALAPYRKASASETGLSDEDITKMQEKVNRVLTLLSTMQDKSGGYAAPNDNPWTLAQVLTTIGLYQINPVSDASVIHDGKTLFDASLQYIDTENNTVDENLMSYAPAQLLRGLTSSLDAAEGGKGLYDTETPNYKATVTEYDAGIKNSDPVSADNICKKVKPAKKTYTIKNKGKSVKVTFNVTAADKNKVTSDKASATVKSTKVARITKKKLSKGKYVVTVKAVKKGKTTLTVKVGQQSAKVTIKVKK